MKLQSSLRSAVKLLVKELMVSFPMDTYEAQITLNELLWMPEMVNKIRTTVELQFMGEVENE